MIGRTNSGVGGGGVLGGTAVLTVNAPASVTTTVSKGDKVFIKSSGSTGIVKFGGLSTGTWNVKIDGNGQSRNHNVNITADYSTTIRFFEATINITYPVGSTVTATLGGLVLRAPNTSGTWACKVPQAGTWVIKSTLGSESDQKNAVISSDGQTVSVSLAYNKIPAFTYTGNYQIVDDNDSPITTSKGNWKIRFLTSGTLTFTDLRGAANGIDVFLVGGGGGGSCKEWGNFDGRSGGGGGYTKTIRQIAVTTSTPYPINIGAGGAGGSQNDGNGKSGGVTSAFGNTANGGIGAGNYSGGAGGSGGGSGEWRTGLPAGSGGADGANGGKGNGAPGGIGQGSTTREFGESNAKLYAGGGGGAHHNGANGTGGKGGGGNGNSTGGAENTGGGGGGKATDSADFGYPGGSGIVVIRNKR